MRALPSSTAFDPRLTPMSLYGAARLVEDEHPDEADELAGFAADLAAIQNLPVTDDPGPNIDLIRRYAP